MAFIFPKPDNWNDFEDIVADVFSRVYKNLNLQRYGRSGQRQHGVDIAGRTEQGLLGVQCKHHLRADIATDEIDVEVAKSEQFAPTLAEYVIATSADRDVKSHSHVLELDTHRQAAGTYGVSIKYWEDICAWLVNYPDLVYKHFTKFYPQGELAHLYLTSFLTLQKAHLQWPFTADELQTHLRGELAQTAQIDPYMLSISLTTFPDIPGDGQIDVVLSLSEMIETSTDVELTFLRAVEIIKQFQAAIGTRDYAKKLVLYINARLSYAFLVGWLFRRVRGYELYVIARQEVWPTAALLYTPAMLSDDLPLMRNNESTEAVLILNFSRTITPSVIAYIDTWEAQPKAIVNYRLEGGVVLSAAHANSLSLEVSRRIKQLIDNGGIRRIHLFGALPAALAVLIGHNLNAICPISIYFMDDSRTTYYTGGTLTNVL